MTDPSAPRRCALAALFVLACRGGTTAPDEPARQGSPAAIQCPSGTTMRGAAPPTGDRVWCERKDGASHGPVREWFADGQRRLDGGYDGGRKHGAWKTFYAGGKPRAEEHWDAGTPTGTWRTWFADGTHATEALHRPGGVVAFTSFRPDGSKQRQGTYVDGREDGEWTEWDAAGVATVAVWKDGVKGGGAAAGPIGIAECDEYVAKLTTCIEQRVPEAARAQMREALKQTVVAWRQVSEGPGKDTIGFACKTALDAAKQATASMGCEW